ncbi:phasin family protein, partial [Aquisalimonas sp.]
TDQTLTQIQKQLDAMIASPARICSGLMLDHFEQLWTLQCEAARAYTTASLECTRAALDISNPTDIQAYVDNQRRLASKLSELAKNDADTVASLNQTFVLKAQEVAGESARSMSRAAEDGVRQLISAAEQNARSASGVAGQAG